MTQLLVAHVKLKMILKLIQKFNPCVNSILIPKEGGELLLYLEP